jgi:hypothetical protein
LLTHSYVVADLLIHFRCPPRLLLVLYRLP